MIFTAKDNPHARYSVQLSDINELIKKDPAALIKHTGEYYDNQVKKAAEEIKNEGRHIVLLSGPSGSGKTTTANKLKNALSLFGKTAHVVSLDDFFLGKGRYPKLPDGRDNFESVYALDLQLIRKTISDMLDTGFAKMPRFDFGISERIDNAYQLSVGENDIVIFEGIHALNPILLPENHGRDAHRMYVSPKCRVFDGDEELFCGKELRLYVTRIFQGANNGCLVLDIVGEVIKRRQSVRLADVVAKHTIGMYVVRLGHYRFKFRRNVLYLRYVVFPNAVRCRRNRLALDIAVM